MDVSFPASTGYSDIQRIGTGASGIVCSARHLKLGAVALKVAHCPDDTERGLLISEYQLLRSLKHTGLLTLFDFGYTDDRRPYFVMELCPRGNLYEYVDQLPVRQRFSPLASILPALEYLHNLDIVHRDIKGENVLVTGSGVAKLSDLGFAARPHDGNRERSGTLEYMAPEIIDNQGATARSDIYSLGVMLYRLALGRLPFAGPDPARIISDKQHPERLDATELSSIVSERFARLVLRCLEVIPDQRPRHVREVIEQLFLEGLIAIPDNSEPTLESYLFHNLYSINTSFCRQELKRCDRNFALLTTIEESKPDLMMAITDHLKTRGCVIGETDNASKIHYTNTQGQSWEIRCVRTMDDLRQGETVLEYRDLDSYAHQTLLNRLLHNSADTKLVTFLYSYDGGHLDLLRTILQQFEQDGKIELASMTLRLKPQDFWNFSPPDYYYKTLGELVPVCPDSLRPTVNLLCADRHGYSLCRLLSAGYLTDAEIEKLRQCGILAGSTLEFAHPAFPHHFYHHLAAHQRQQLHSRWVQIIEADTDLPSIQRLKMLFFHLRHAGNFVAAVETALKCADELQQGGKHEEAWLMLEEARPAAETGQLSDQGLRLLLNSAILAKSLGDLDASLHDFSRVVRLALLTGDKRTAAAAYKQLGDIYKTRRDYRRGDRVLTKAVHYFGEIGDDLELSHCLNNLGNLYCIAGDLEKAAASYETALEVQRGLNALRDVASSLSNLGTIKFIQQDFAEGIRLLKESAAIKRQINDLPELARTLNNLALAYSEQDELEIARDYIEEAVRINVELAAEKELLHNYDNVFEIEMRQGRYHRAKQWLLAGLRLVKPQDRYYRAMYMTYLAEVMLVQGRYGKARALLHASRKAVDGVTDRLLGMRLEATLADYYRLLFDFDSANRHLTTAIETAEKLGEMKTKANCLLRQAMIERSCGEDGEVVWHTLSEAEGLLTSLSVKREWILLQLERAELQIRAGSFEIAGDTLNVLDEQAEQEIFTPLRARHFYLNALIERNRGRYDSALALIRAALESSSALGTEDMTWRILALAGEIYRTVGKPELALKMFAEAFELIRKLAMSIGDDRLCETYMTDPEKLEIAAGLEELSVHIQNEGTA